MGLQAPERNTVLPPKIQGLLNRMYAGNWPYTGMSAREILNFFRRYSGEIEAYSWDTHWRPSRWRIFEDCLARFSLAQQKDIIQDLVDYSGPMTYLAPSPDDIATIRQWLWNAALAGASIDYVRFTPDTLQITIENGCEATVEFISFPRVESPLAL
jgi:hypothetical protein